MKKAWVWGKKINPEESSSQAGVETAAMAEV